MPKVNQAYLKIADKLAEVKNYLYEVVQKKIEEGKEKDTIIKEIKKEFSPNESVICDIENTFFKTAYIGPGINELYEEGEISDDTYTTIGKKYREMESQIAPLFGKGEYQSQEEFERAFAQWVRAAYPNIYDRVASKENIFSKGTQDKKSGTDTYNDTIYRFFPYTGKYKKLVELIKSKAEVLPMEVYYAIIEKRKEINRLHDAGKISFIRAGELLEDYLNSIDFFNGYKEANIDTSDIPEIDFSKVSYIKKLKDKEKWRVYSESGKNLGTYDSVKDAKSRLKEIEFFKHKKKSNNNPYLQKQADTLIGKEIQLKNDTVIKFNEFNVAIPTTAFGIITKENPIIAQFDIDDIQMFKAPNGKLYYTKEEVEEEFQKKYGHYWEMEVNLAEINITGAESNIEADSKIAESWLDQAKPGDKVQLDGGETGEVLNVSEEKVEVKTPTKTETVWKKKDTGY